MWLLTWSNISLPLSPFLKHNSETGTQLNSNGPERLEWSVRENKTNARRGQREEENQDHSVHLESCLERDHLPVSGRSNERVFRYEWLQLSSFHPLTAIWRPRTRIVACSSRSGTGTVLPGTTSWARSHSAYRKLLRYSTWFWFRF